MTKQLGLHGYLVGLLSVLLLVWGVSRSARQKDHFDNPPVWDDAAASIPVSSKDPSWGSRYAPVTIVVFSDYQCPHCKKVEDTFALLKQKYGGEQLRIVWKNYPLGIHIMARPAAEAGAVVFDLAGNDVFWRFHERVFDNAKTITPDSLADWAEEVGVDAAKFRAAVSAKAGAEKVKADMALGQAHGVRGTPAAFINGVFKSGGLPASEYEKVIDAELEATAELLRAGVPRDQLYVTRTLFHRPRKDAPPAATSSASAPPPGEGTADRDGPAEKDKSKRFRIPLEDSETRGSADALVTIVELGDLSCPFTAAVEPTLQALLAEYPGKVRLVFKHYPMAANARAIPAALLALFAKREKGSESFWAARDRLLTKPNGLSEQDLLAIGQELGLDTTKLREVIKDGDPTTPEHEASAEAKPFLPEIERDMALGSDFDALNTPHFFINGRRLVGAQPAESFKKLIEAELSRASELIAAGTAPTDVYAALMKDAEPPTELEIRLIDPPASEMPSRGPADARVALHAFLDFECVFCKRAQNVLSQLDKVYGKEVRFVFRDHVLPNHKHGFVAAEAAREAFAQKGAAGFFAFHDGLFELTATPDFGRPAFERLAAKQGLDVAAFKSVLDGGAHRHVVEEANRQALSYEFRGTPAFVITFGQQGDKLEGFFLSGALPFSKFRKAIKQAQARAR